MVWKNYEGKMKIVNYILLLLSITFLISCSNPNQKKGLLLNSDFSNGVTNEWWPFRGINHKYVTDINDSIYFSEKYSASISCDSLTDSFSYWGQIINSNLPLNNKLKLKLKIKLENVEGNGVGFAIRFDNSDKIEGSAEKFTTTQGRKQIIGTHNWKDYEITSELLTDDIKSVTVYLLMFGNTTGKVYFDNVELFVAQN